MIQKSLYHLRRTAPGLALVCAALVITLAVSSKNARAQEPILPPLAQPLQLPPGLVEALPIDKTGSVFGDILRAVDCPDDNDLPYGLCGNVLFGDHAMVDSHLSGIVRIRFYPPVRNITHFEVSLGVLTGDDSILQSPQGFEMPVLNAKVSDVPGTLSEGDLDLTTGVSTNLQSNAFYFDSALDALIAVNPNLVAPIIVFPGSRGYA